MGIYLDNAATSFPKPKEVADAVYDFMINNGTSSGRGSYKKAMQSDYIVYECRKLIGNLFNFDDPKKVVFTSNVTDSLNIAIRGILKENDHVITSSLEHNAVWRCLKTLEKDISSLISMGLLLLVILEDIFQNQLKMQLKNLKVKVISAQSLLEEVKLWHLIIAKKLDLKIWSAMVEMA